MTATSSGVRANCRSAMLLGLAVTCIALRPDTIAEAEPVGGLVVRVSNVRAAGGVIRVDICTGSMFLKSCAFSGSETAVIGTTSVVIRNLKPGTYGAQIFHDRNGNGKVDRRFLGVPTEGVGFSNDAPIRLGPPKFSDAAFVYRGGTETIDVKLRYF
jgi:uncharacterized protein (DUF2141 family)